MYDLSRDLQLRNAALDAATSHFMILDGITTDPIIAYVNRAFAGAYRYEVEELVGRSAESLPFASDGRRITAFVRDVIEGRSVRAEVEVVRKDGTTFWLGFYAAPVFGADGKVTHAVWVGADITARLEADRKKRELQESLLDEMRERERLSIELRLAQKLEAVGRLAAGVAHEINTPVQYVADSVHFLRSAFADLDRLRRAYRDALASLPDSAMRRGVSELEDQADLEFLEAEVPKAFERSLDGIQRVASIVGAMREFAHPGTSQHSPADLNHALETTSTVAQSEYRHVAKLVTDLGDIPPVTCNLSELNQVFLNLIVNAGHAVADSGTSEGRISVATRAAGDWVEITIADNGCGIAADNLDNIFDPFFTTKAVGRGSGQGLAIARSIVVDKHGGELSVSSEVGVGSRFLVRLPIDGAQRASALGR